MRPLLTAEEMRILDSHTIRKIGIPGPVLMENAGRGVFAHLWETFGERARAGRTVVVCGRGNNGGDGFVVARYLAQRDCKVLAVLPGTREGVAGDAAVHMTAYAGCGGEILEVGASNRSAGEVAVAEADLLVDAVLGTGLTEDVRGLSAEAIEWLNASPAPVVSVDIPSGVSSNTGRICGTAVKADLTVTFAYAKRGHYLHPGASLAGRLEVVEIGIPPRALELVTPGVQVLESSDFRGLLARPVVGHKGTFGHVFVLGGGPGKEGAGGLAAWAGLRSGAGLSTLCWPAGLSVAGAARLPLEVMTEPLPHAGSPALEWEEAMWASAERALSRAAALVVGPGMGTGDGVQGLLRHVFASEGPPLVIDADGLNVLALRPELWPRGFRQGVFTPHPGEAARLLGRGVREIQQDRVGAVRALAEEFRVEVILKGAHTLVAGPETPVFVVPCGNPGMATAGAGDVLSGVVAALLARGLSILDAARLGAYAHASAGDLAAKDLGLDGVTATDILHRVPEALRRLAEA